MSHQKNTLITVFRSAFIALLIGITSNSYACTDLLEEFSTNIAEPLVRLVKATGGFEYNFSYEGIIKHEMIGEAELISRTSKRCAKYAEDKFGKNDEIVKRLLSISVHADSFARHAEGFKSALESSANHAKKGFDSVGDGDIANAAGHLLFGMSFQNGRVEFHNERMLEKLKTMVEICECVVMRKQ